MPLPVIDFEQLANVSNKAKKYGKMAMAGLVIDSQTSQTQSSCGPKAIVFLTPQATMAKAKNLVDNGKLNLPGIADKAAGAQKIVSAQGTRPPLSSTS